MIGFRPEETDHKKGGLKSADQPSKPGEKEVPPEKPGREIFTPAPFTIPSPQPDTIITSPSPEITPLPMESPAPSQSPEISPIEPAEFS